MFFEESPCTRPRRSSSVMTLALRLPLAKLRAPRLMGRLSSSLVPGLLRVKTLWKENWRFASEPVLEPDRMCGGGLGGRVSLAEGTAEGTRSGSVELPAQRR